MLRFKYCFLSFLFIVVLSACSLSALAQGKFYLGPIMGTGISSMSGRFTHFHIQTGLISSYKLKDKLSLQTSLLYSAKGCNDVFIKPDKSFHLTYYDLFLVLKYNFGKYLFAGGGLQTGWLVDAKYSDHDVTSSKYMKSYVHDFDLGVVGNFGIQFLNGIGFELSFTQGLINVVKPEYKDALAGDEHLPSYNLPKWAEGKNAVIDLSFYCLFGKH